MRAPEWSGSCPLCRCHVSVYSLRDASGGPLVTPQVSSPFGSVFVQSGGLGVASYHFNAEDDCYISYTAAPPTWLLSDGSVPPSKKPWSLATYDPEARTFHGTVEWDPPFGKDVRWDHKIVFSEDFVGIVGGHVVSIQADGSSETVFFGVPWEDNWEQRLTYLRWTPPPSSPFGSVYVQGRMYSSGLEGVASYHFASESDCYISYSNAPSDWLLDDGSPPPARKPFTQISYDPVKKTLRGTIEWVPSFDGSVRWEYTIRFAEDFGSIVGGRMIPYRSSWLGQIPCPGRSFGDPGDGSRWNEGRLFYAQKPTVLTLSEKMHRDLMFVGSPLPEVPRRSAIDAVTQHVASDHRHRCTIC